MAFAVFWLAVITVVCDVLTWTVGPRLWLQGASWSLGLMIGLAVLSVIGGALRGHARAATDRRQTAAYAGIGLACVNFVMRFGARDQFSSFTGLVLSLSSLILLAWALKSSAGQEGGVEPPTGVY